MKQSKLRFIFLLALASVVYVSLTLSAVFQKSHILYNLEPYPDGLLYALSARNFALQGKLELQYESSILPFWTQPLYSLLLVPLFTLSQRPEMFFISNVVMGVVTLSVVSWAVWKRTKNVLLVLLSQVILLSHGYFLWVVNVPMAENAVLMIVSLLVYVLLNTEKWSAQPLFITIVLAGALAATKFMLVPVAGGVSLIAFVWYVNDSYKKQQWKIYLVSFVVVALVSYYMQLHTVLSEFTHELGGNSKFFAFSNIGENIFSYRAKLLGPQLIQGSFLWLSVPLTSLGMFCGWLFAIYYLLRSNTQSDRRIGGAVVSIFLLHLPLLLLFYVSDTRYLIALIVLIAVSIPIALPQLYSWKPRLTVGVTVVVFCLHLFTQFPLYKEIVAANLLGRSTAWQHQSILHFNSFATLQALKYPETVFITALPPFLVAAYQTAPYHVLPLSRHQEFIAKDERVWGTELDYTDLSASYKRLLEKGTRLYISNAYVTQQASVIADYEQLKQQFELELVSEGCDHACDIYLVKKKSEDIL